MLPRPSVAEGGGGPPRVSTLVRSGVEHKKQKKIICLLLERAFFPDNIYNFFSIGSLGGFFVDDNYRIHGI